MKAKTVDTSYRERRRVVRLLDFLTRDQLTRDQMERIGRRLQKAGRHALPPLVRRLWKERDRERLYRYTCMLDFFDAKVWIDQLVALTLKRRDLDEDDRIPLLEILQDYGVDVSCPPFARQALSLSGLNDFIELCFNDRDWGMVRFMDRFLDADEPMRCQLIKRLGLRHDKGAEAAAYLRMLAYFEFVEVAGLAVDILGMLRHGCALAVLDQLQYLTVEGLQPRIARSRRRLGFVGIGTAESLPPQFSVPAQCITAQASPIDAQGMGTIWFSWATTGQGHVGLVLQISERDGVVQAISTSFQSRKEHDAYLDDVNIEEGMFPVDYSYCVKRLRDALYRSIEHNYYLPPDLYASRHFFGCETDLRPECYLPSFDVGLLSSLSEKLAFHLINSETLLEEPFFEGWMMYDPAVYAIAESLGEPALDACPPDEQNPFIERFCEEVVEPDREGIVRRLLLTADLMQQTGCTPRIIQRTLAVSLSVAGTPLPLARHPFIRRLAIDSIMMAVQSLAEGVDPRQQAFYDGEDDE